MSTINSGIFGPAGLGGPINSSAGLSDAFGIAQSGMQAAQTQMNVVANNVANLNTPGYQSQRADLVELSSNGVGDGVAVSGISTDTAPGDPLAIGGGSGNPATPSSNVDLAPQMIAMKQAQVLYDANAVVLNVASQMIGTLIDVMNNADRSSNSSN